MHAFPLPFPEDRLVAIIENRISPSDWSKYPPKKSFNSGSGKYISPSMPSIDRLLICGVLRARLADWFKHIFWEEEENGDSMNDNETIAAVIVFTVSYQS